MKRLHVNLSVADLGASVRFYSGLFGAPPSVLKPDYAKWMLDDPRVNFALAARGRTPGLDHLGIQAEAPAELVETYGRMREAGTLLDEGAATCCYAHSDKGWVHDPEGIAWEAFLTHGEATTYGSSGERPQATTGTTCCAPAVPSLPQPDAACCAPR